MKITHNKIPNLLWIMGTLQRVYSEMYLPNMALLMIYTVEPLLRGQPDERPAPLERPLDNVNLNMNVLISTPDERPPFLTGNFSDAKGVASQEDFHCKCIGKSYGESNKHVMAIKSFFSC